MSFMLKLYFSLLVISAAIFLLNSPHLENYSDWNNDEIFIGLVWFIHASMPGLYKLFHLIGRVSNFIFNTKLDLKFRIICSLVCYVGNIFNAYAVCYLI